MAQAPVDPQLHGLLGYSELTEKFVSELRNESIRDLGNVFRLNMHRAYQLAVGWIAIAHHAAQYERRRCMARVRLGLNPNDDSKDESAEFEKAFAAASSEWLASRLAMGDAWINARVTHDGAAIVDMLVRAGLSSQSQAKASATWAPSGVRSLLGALITTSYAAYESLAQDLWVLALNAKPKLAATWLQNGDVKHIQINELIGEGFDLSKTMGTYLRRTDKVSLDSFKSIEAAYSRAFGSEIAKCFEPRNEIRLTEQLRHSLAHRAGIVDEKFLKAVKAWPNYAEMKPGDLLQFTGQRTREHVDACVHSAGELLEYLDRYLADADIESRAQS